MLNVRKESIMVGVLFFVIFFAVATKIAASASIDCSHLRPMRATSTESKENINAGADFILKRLASGEFVSESSFKYKEKFPEFMITDNLFEIERFYYMVCLALSDERFDPERRFVLFMRAERERKETLSETLNRTLESGTTVERVDAVQRGVELGGEFERLAVDEGLRSDNPSVRGAVVMSLIERSNLISGTVSPSGTSAVAAFSIKINETERAGSVLNFSGQFFGGIFYDEEHFEDAIGTISGDAFHFSNRTCSLSAKVSREEKALIGQINCTKGYWWGSQRRDNGVIIIPLL